MKRTAMVTVAILVLVALLVPCAGLAQENTPPVRPYPEKDPFIAGLLSWLMMGTGQMYCREYTKGSIFIAADLVDKIALILLISHINSTYAPQSGEIININFSSFDTGTQALTLLYLVGSLSLRAYSVIDAMNSAKKYNERIFAPRRQEGLDFSLGADRVSVEYTIRFDK
ncbi:MAG: hypothetical protein JXQ30_03925 [Spirochaetes bacterium]|nr:hypothetical protein [Spirochaetota bacterium]